MSDIKRTSKKYPNKKLFKKALFKVLAVFVCIAVNLTGLSAVGNTFAYFIDSRTLENNTFETGVLAFTALSSNNDPSKGIAPYNIADPSTEYKHILDLSKIGTLDFNYSITLGDFDDGTSTGFGLCDNLMVKDDLPGSVFVMLKSYSLPLASYSTNPSIKFTIRLISSNPGLMNQTCSFDYRITAWQTNMLDNSTGFSDQKLVSDSILSDPWEVEPTQTGGQGYGGEETTGNEENAGNIEGDGNNEEDQNDPVKEEDPAIEPQQNEGDTDAAGQDEITQDNTGEENTGNTDGNSGGGEEITGDGEGELTTA